MKLNYEETKKPYAYGDVVIRGTGENEEALQLHAVATSHGILFYASFLNGDGTVGLNDKGEMECQNIGELIRRIKLKGEITHHFSRDEYELNITKK